MSEREGGRWWAPVLKVGVTAGLLIVIFRQLDWTEFGHTLVTARLSLVGIVALLMMLSVTISAYKWQQLLAVHGLRYGMGNLQRWYFIAVFFNNFLPTSIGGDGYRVLKTFKNDRSAAHAVIAVTMERLSGLAVLLGLAYAAAVMLWTRSGNPLAGWLVAVTTAGGALSAAVLVALIATGWMGRALRHPRCPTALRTAWEGMGDFRMRPWRGVWALLGVSVAFHLHTLFFYWILLRAVGQVVDPLALIVVLAVTGVASVLPISINGIGVVEGSFAYTAVQFGIPYEAALSAILIVRGVKLLQSAVGAAFYVTAERGRTPRRISPEAMDGAPPVPSHVTGAPK